MMPSFVKNKNKGYIVESGSNQKGQYVKFSNGLAICKGSFNITENTSEMQINFPINFVNTGYSVTVTSTYAYSKKIFFAVVASNKESFKVFPTLIDTNTVPTMKGSGYYIAMGNWK